VALTTTSASEGETTTLHALAQGPTSQGTSSSSESNTVPASIDPPATNLPSTFDVVSGRGRTIQERLGNVLLHRLVHLHVPRYNDAPRTDRRDIAKEIVHGITNNGSRFLKQESGQWVELNEDEAIEKVSHCFRSRRGSL
jgi:hypothetical protein